jgi:hypothetical protein
MADRSQVKHQIRLLRFQNLSQRHPIPDINIMNPDSGQRDRMRRARRSARYSHALNILATQVCGQIGADEAGDSRNQSA